MFRPPVDMPRVLIPPAYCSRTKSVKYNVVKRYNDVSNTKVGNARAADAELRPDEDHGDRQGAATALQGGVLHVDGPPQQAGRGSGGARGALGRAGYGVRHIHRATLSSTDPADRPSIPCRSLVDPDRRASTGDSRLGRDYGIYGHVFMPSTAM